MTHQTFTMHLADWLLKIETVLFVKNAEYSVGEECLHSFYRGAAMSQQIPEKVLYGFFLKHLVSVIDMIDGIEGGKIPSVNQTSEKIGDCICYLILLDAIIKDRRELNDLHTPKKSSV